MQNFLTAPGDSPDTKLINKLASGPSLAVRDNSIAGVLSFTPPPGASMLLAFSWLPGQGRYAASLLPGEVYFIPPEGVRDQAETTAATVDMGFALHQGLRWALYKHYCILPSSHQPKGGSQSLQPFLVPAPESPSTWPQQLPVQCQGNDHIACQMLAGKDLRVTEWDGGGTQGEHSGRWSGQQDVCEFLLKAEQTSQMKKVVEKMNVCNDGYG